MTVPLGDAPPPGGRGLGMTPTVHALAFGRALCGQVHGPPCDWGEAHRWVSAFDPEAWRARGICAECRSMVERLWKEEGLE